MVLSKNKKRFITGKKRPQCNTLDSVALTLENTVEKLTCAVCDYTQTQSPTQAKSAIRQFEQIIGILNQSKHNKE